MDTLVLNIYNKIKLRLHQISIVLSLIMKRKKMERLQFIYLKRTPVQISNIWFAVLRLRSIK